MDKKKLKTLSSAAKESAIRLAWADRIPFEEIERRTQLTEAEVIALMRRELRPGSFRLWRKRVNGRVTKHRHRARIKYEVRPDERMS